MRIKLGNIPIDFLTAFLLNLPMRISPEAKAIAAESTIHEYLTYICSKMGISHLRPRIEARLYQKQTSYEEALSAFLTRTTGDLFVDIGANVGRFTILLGNQYKRVIAIEPVPQMMCALRTNTQFAGLKNVEFLQCAVSNKDGYAELHLSSHSETHSLHESPQGQRMPGTDRWVGATTGETLRVQTQTLATILNKKQADLVKVDVEGAEWLVLEGAQPVIDQVKSWVVELHDWWKDDSKAKIEKWFAKRGYTCSWMDINHIYATK